MRWLLSIILLLFMAAPSFAATYYYSKAGNNGNSCPTATSSMPVNAKLTIAAAIACAVAGDTVTSSDTSRQVYYERNSIPNSGVMGSPIIISGKLGPTGQRLTVVNGADETPLTGWVTAPEVGGDAPTYKTAMRTWAGPESGSTIGPCVLTSDDKAVWRVGTVHADPLYNLTFDVNEISGFSNDNVPYWEGTEALFANVGGMTYLRFRNGDNPASKTIRIAPWRQNCGEGGSLNDFAGFLIKNKNYVTIRDFEIANISSGVLVEGTSTGVRAENVYVRHGHYALYSASTTVNTVFNGNEINNDMIGFAAYQPEGEHGGGPDFPNTYHDWVSFQQYNFDKQIESNCCQSHFGMWLGGTNTSATNNTVRNVSTGIFTQGLNGGTIRGNSVHNVNGSCLLVDLSFSTGTLDFDDNEVSSCGTPIRAQYGEYNPAGLTVNIHHNKIWHPAGKGQAAYIEGYGTVNTPIRIYNNTYIGGWNGYATGYQNRSWVQTIAFNNLWQMWFDITTYYDAGWGSDNYGSGWFNNPTGLKRWDYNAVYAARPSAVWKGASNLALLTKPIADSGVAPPADWEPSVGSAALEAGLDCSVPFTLNSVAYPALPGCTSLFNGAAPDIGAIEDAAIIPPPEDIWPAEDDFESYTLASDLHGLNGGAGWILGWQRDFYDEFPVDGTCAIVTAPAGMTGKSVLCDSNNPTVYYRRFQSTSGGQMHMNYRLTGAAPNGEVMLAGFTAGANQWLTGIRWDSDGFIKAVTPGDVEVTVAAYAANTTGCIDMTIDSLAHPGQYKIRHNASETGAAYVNFITPGYDTMEILSIQQRTTNVDFHFDEIAEGPCPNPAPGVPGSVSWVLPLENHFYRVGETVDLSWTHTGTSGLGSWTIDYALDDGTQNIWFPISTPAFAFGARLRRSYTGIIRPRAAAEIPWPVINTPAQTILLRIYKTDDPTIVATRSIIVKGRTHGGGF